MPRGKVEQSTRDLSTKHGRAQDNDPFCLAFSAAVKCDLQILRAAPLHRVEVNLHGPGGLFNHPQLSSRSPLHPPEGSDAQIWRQSFLQQLKPLRYSARRFSTRGR